MPNVRSVRAKLGYDAFRQYDRAALLALCAAENVKQQPAGWVAGAAVSISAAADMLEMSAVRPAVASNSVLATIVPFIVRLGR